MKELQVKKTKVVPLEKSATTGVVDPGILRTHVRMILDGKRTTLIMAVIALWVLFGDDIKVMTTNQEADLGFAISYVICLQLFIIEIIMNGLVVDEYKFSFFFWLDVIAALSLIPDIYFIINPLLSLFNTAVADANANVNLSGVRNDVKISYVNRVWRSVRFIRLVRIVKLYKYFTKQKSLFNKRKENNESVASGGMQSPMDPAALGRKLSDITTRRVIIMVLLILVILPILQSTVIDNSRYYGLQQLFWAGRSNCALSYEFNCLNQVTPYVNTEGWYELLRRYSQSGAQSEGGQLSGNLLWLRVPDFTQNGNMTEIKHIPSDIWGNFGWDEVEDCAGFTVPAACTLRSNEMNLVVYSPAECMNQTVKGCEELLCYARFDIKSSATQESLLNVFVTLFVGVIFALASVLFGIDTQRIVIGPITKMVMLIKNLADDPLHMQEDPGKTQRTIKETESSILEETLSRIGNLIKVSFGKNNEEIVSSYLNSEELDMFKPGNTVRLIFGFVQIQQFTEITDLLQEQVLLFLNKIGKIVHACTGEWKGTPIKNDMGSFLVIWDQGHQNATQALLAFIKIIAETRRAGDITIYKNNPKISAKWPEYQVQLGFSLHLGWAVQGVIGTEEKMDVAYFSPHLELGQEVLSATSLYQTWILMTEVFYLELPKKAREYCRRIDTVISPLEPDPIGLYCYDMNDSAPPASANTALKIGAPFLLYELEQTAGDLISINVKNYEDLFLIESDVVTFQKNLVNRFTELWKHAYQAYTEGNWPESLAFMDQCHELRPDDGPESTLRTFMEDNGRKAPEDWSGCRSLV